MNDLPQHKPIRLAVLISGGGTTLQNLINQIARQELNCTIRIVIGSRNGLKGLDRAAAAKLPGMIVDRKSSSTVSDYSKLVFAAIDKAEVDLVCFAGWLCLLDIPSRYAGRVINIHPSLLPKFGGKGMYGQKVHQAVLDSREQVTGCTVHYVDNEYDHGPIILQRSCPVLPGDTATTLAARVFEEEKIAYPDAIQRIQSGKAHI